MTACRCSRDSERELFSEFLRVRSMAERSGEREYNLVKVRVRPRGLQ
jgi:hypothetical protein